MKPFAWLARRASRLSPEQLARRDALPVPAVLDERPLTAQRFVVLDVETSGLDLHKDEVLSIGAVVIEDGAIDFGQLFEITLQRRAQRLSPSVLIHGLAPSAIAAGADPAEALLGFMAFVGDSPLLAFHAGFDQRMLARALKHTLGYRLQHLFLDVAHLAPLLCPEGERAHAGLDHWIAHFGLQVQQRHHASADALVTAEIALILFNHARRQGLASPRQLLERLAQRQRRQQLSGF